MRYIIMILIFGWIIILGSYSQDIRLVSFHNQPDYSKNCDKINNCIEKIQFSGDTLIIEILAQISKYTNPILEESVDFRADTLYLDYDMNPIIIDTIIEYNTVNKKYDTLYVIGPMEIRMNNDYLSRLIYKTFGLSNFPSKIVYNNIIISNCPDKPLEYEILNGDTVNMINSNGWKDGKWISTIKMDSINLIKIKYYNNRQFIDGFIINEKGDTTYGIDNGESSIQILTPYNINNK